MQSSGPISMNEVKTFIAQEYYQPGAIAVGGYYPLFTSAAAANSNQAGDGTSHTHSINGVTYYMPNGLTAGTTQFHGDFASAAYSNISLSDLFSSAQIVTPQPAVLPNGNFVAPHQVAEFYDAYIQMSSIEITSIEELTYNLIINVNAPAGSTASASGAGTYSPGAVVNISASFNSSDEEFSSWSGGTVADSNSATTTVTMNGDVTLTANIGEKTCEDVTTIEYIPGRVPHNGGWEYRKMGGHGAPSYPYKRLYNVDLNPFNLWTYNQAGQLVQVPASFDGVTGGSWSGYNLPANMLEVSSGAATRSMSAWSDTIVAVYGRWEQTKNGLVSTSLWPHGNIYILASFAGGTSGYGRTVSRLIPKEWPGEFYVGNGGTTGPYTAPTPAQIANAATIIQC